MKRIAFALIATAGVAHAHPGHVAAANGHDHWGLAAGLIVLALAVVPVALRLIRK